MVVPLLLAALLLALALPATAGEAKPAKKAKLPKARKLFHLNWYGSWQEAVEVNRKRSGKGRPILLLRILGDLSGVT